MIVLKVQKKYLFVALNKLRRMCNNAKSYKELEKIEPYKDMLIKQSIIYKHDYWGMRAEKIYNKSKDRMKHKNIFRQTQRTCDANRIKRLL